MAEATLLQTAEREALEAEAEYESMTPKQRKAAEKKAAAAKPNGKANGVHEPLVASKPGEQGIATQEEEDQAEPAKVWNRTASQQEIALAEDILIELRSRAQEMGADAVIDSLLKVVDVHPRFVMPHEWPADAEAVLVESELLGEIGRLLCRGCAKIEVAPNHVLFLWKNQKSWTKKGVQVMCEAKKLGELPAFFAGGGRAVVIGNFQLFRLFNTRKKLAAIYHALRSLDAEGNIRPNQFEGFFDELELFGTGTFQTDVLLARAIEHAAQRELPFAEQVDAFTAAAATDPDEGGDNAGDEED